MGILSNTSLSAAPLLAALVLLYLTRTALVWAKLRRFSGPRWAGFSDWPHSTALLSPNCHDWYAEVSEKYGADCLTLCDTDPAPGSLSQVPSRAWRPRSSSPRRPRSGRTSTDTLRTSAPTGTIMLRASSTGGTMSSPRRITRSMSTGASR